MMAPEKVAAGLRQIIDELSDKYLERRGLIEVMVLALLTKQHTFILGDPGTAKSDIARAIVDRFTGDPAYFEIVLTKGMGEQWVNGPTDLPLFRETGDLRRKTKGFLPTSTIVFLDEIGKMGKSLGPTLLPQLNERLYHEVNGGRSAHRIPLHTCFTASNEPLHGEEGQSALYDRLLWRYKVEYIKENANFVRLLRTAVGHDLADSLGSEGEFTTLDWDDFLNVVDNVIPSIGLSPSAEDGYVQLKSRLISEGIINSDRRWRQSVRALQAHAFLNGRSQVFEEDLMVLRHVLWEAEEHIPVVERAVLHVANPLAEKLSEILGSAEELLSGIRERQGQSSEALAQYGTEVNRKLSVLTSELGNLKQTALTQGRDTAQFDEVQGRLKAVMDSVYIDCLGMDPAVVRQS